MQWLKGLLGAKNQQKTRQRLPLAHRTRQGKSVWLYSTFMDVPFSVDDSWQEIRELPRWVQTVLSERSDDYERPGHDDGFALLVNGKKYQYLCCEYCDWGAYGHGNPAYYAAYYRRLKR